MDPVEEILTLSQDSGNTASKEYTVNFGKPFNLTAVQIRSATVRANLNTVNSGTNEVLFEEEQPSYIFYTGFLKGTLTPEGLRVLITDIDQTNFSGNLLELENALLVNAEDPSREFHVVSASDGPQGFIQLSLRGSAFTNDELASPSRKNYNVVMPFLGSAEDGIEKIIRVDPSVATTLAAQNPASPTLAVVVSSNQLREFHVVQIVNDTLLLDSSTQFDSSDLNQHSYVIRTAKRLEFKARLPTMRFIETSVGDRADIPALQIKFSESMAAAACVNYPGPESPLNRYTLAVKEQAVIVRAVNRSTGPLAIESAQLFRALDSYTTDTKQQKHTILLANPGSIKRGALISLKDSMDYNHYKVTERYCDVTWPGIAILGTITVTFIVATNITNVWGTDTEFSKLAGKRLRYDVFDGGQVKTCYVDVPIDQPSNADLFFSLATTADHAAVVGADAYSTIKKDVLVTENLPNSSWHRMGSYATYNVYYPKETLPWRTKPSSLLKELGFPGEKNFTDLQLNQAFKIISIGAYINGYQTIQTGNNHNLINDLSIRIHNITMGGTSASSDTEWTGLIVAERASTMEGHSFKIKTSLDNYLNPYNEDSGTAAPYYTRSGSIRSLGFGAWDYHPHSIVSFSQPPETFLSDANNSPFYLEPALLTLGSALSTIHVKLEINGFEIVGKTIWERVWNDESQNYVTLQHNYFDTINMENFISADYKMLSNFPKQNLKGRKLVTNGSQVSIRFFTKYHTSYPFNTPSAWQVQLSLFTERYT
tara:strand:+ start:7767 stop:10067 length:2301 start_codon:yes stop_codon:yes gene_type:complete